MILDEIVKKKRERLKELKSRKSLSELKRYIRDIPEPLDFRDSIKRRDFIRLIGEIKKASPSKGIIRRDFDLSSIADIYERYCHAISVITEEDFFSGSPEFISSVRERVTRPLLRKDFIIDEYQIYESRALRADAILLIASTLVRAQAMEYLDIAKELGMDVLFEIHNEDELEEALLLKAEIIGINNRNLRTMKVDISNTLRLIEYIPDDRIVVSESGIRTRRDVEMLSQYNVDALLIGTVFMESDNIEKKIRELFDFDKLHEEIG